MLGLNYSNRRFKELAPSNQNGSWIDFIGQIPGIIHFNYKTLPYLAKLLQRYKSEDTYVICPAYHAFTGRYGLWGYARDDAFLLFSRHPNDPNQIIFFPQFGAKKSNLLFEVLGFFSDFEIEFSIARSITQSSEFDTAILNSRQSEFLFRTQQEQVLDWTYPVYTLSTAEVLEAKGKAFKSFRYDLHRINEKEIRTELIDPYLDFQELRSVIQTWAEHKSDLMDVSETIDSYMYLLKLMRMPSLNLSGVKFYREGQLVAFEIWSILSSNSQVANNLAGLNIQSVENLPGFSSYQYYTVCRMLYQQGIDSVCIGGSETAGLDHFKRKMKPIKSLPLQTIKAYRVKREYKCQA